MIISSLVSDVLMPPIGLLPGKVDFSSLSSICQGRHSRLLRQRNPQEPPTLNCGVLFLLIVLDFIIIAFVIFMLVKQVNRFKNEAPPAGPTNEEKLLMEVRDVLKERR
jgi:large conductance mechanosensitive channel